MINPEVLLSDLKKLLGQLEGDLRERADEVPTLGESLRSAYQRAREAERTAQPFETWRDEYLTQAAVAWILGCVFVRFIEDNGLIDTPLLAGSGPRLDQAKDQRTIYFQQHPTDSDREYLYYVFRKVVALPAAAQLFDESHNPLWTFGVSGDGATLLIEFWQRIDPATGALAHDFTDSALNTRFLGDLYQDLSEAARKKYALLQTPEFVEEFILDRTLTPAIAEFGLAEVRLIDPACGSGHFLLGAFHRLLREWQKREPAVNVRELSQRALDAVFGVDLNPYAVAIARFRLLIVALKVSDVHRLADAPAFHTNLATGDSLLHGPRPGGERQMYLSAEADPLRHVYEIEDAAELRRILGGGYHVVVGNPPYITAKDNALNEAYRHRFASCYRKYSLAAPFMERFFDLALAPEVDGGLAGYVGMITANSFMKREFGKKLIEEFIPHWDLTHVIDTSGAYIPGHATPTVILLARHREPVEETVRGVLGIRGEPQTPDDPSKGVVWSAILDQVDKPGSLSSFVSATDMQRESLCRHPWSIGGGGAAELKALLDEAAEQTLADIVEVVGVFGMTNADDAMVAPEHSFQRRGVEPNLFRRLVVGDELRDWTLTRGDCVLFPYQSEELVDVSRYQGYGRWMWPVRTALGNRATFGKRTYFAEHRPWWEWHQVCLERLRNQLSVTFAVVSTHNNFVLDRGGNVFNRHAPLIKLPAAAPVQDHVALLALLNSSTACFWLKQVMSCKGLGGQGGGIKPEDWHRAYEFDTTKLLSFPIVASSERLISLASSLQVLAERLAECEPESIIVRERGQLKKNLGAARGAWERTRAWMIALQEEIDWEVYTLYGLADASACDSVLTECVLNPKDRPAERLLRQSHEQTIYYDVHGDRGFGSLETSAFLETISNKRLATIANTPALRLIESVNHKRRWQVDPWEQRVQGALRGWLLSRLESAVLWSSTEPMSAARLSDHMRRDGEFLDVSEVYRGRADFDVLALVTELIESDAVPFLAVLRYRPTGLRTRAAWERTWDLQRREDAIDARITLPEGDLNRLTSENADALKRQEVGNIPMPPKYTSGDFVSPTFWRLRGKLDVPKERFISYPYAEREADPTLVIGWAGWDHLQQAKALAAYYVRMKEQEGWAPERLQPLLAGLLELLPWLKQWHNDLDPAYGIGMGDYFAGFVDEEARALGFTLDVVQAWQPPAKNLRRRRRAKV